MRSSTLVAKRAKRNTSPGHYTIQLYRHAVRRSGRSKYGCFSSGRRRYSMVTTDGMTLTSCE